MDVPTLILLPPADVRREWSYIRQGIASAFAFDGDGTMPEDVFSALMVDQAQLWMARIGDEPDNGPEGFIVTRTFHTPTGPELLVWVGYHNGGAGRAADYWPQIAGIAAATDHVRVTIESTRPYHRAGIRGVRLARHVFHYEVE